MSPSRGYPRRDSGHNPSYGYGNAYGNNYGNSYAGYGYTDGYPEYEHHQYSQEQQYQPEQYQTEQYQYQHQQYHQQYPQQYSQYHDAFAYDTYNEYVPQRRPSPSYDTYDDSSAARRRPFAQSSRGYGTYSTSSPPSSSSPSYSRPPPPPRSQPSTEPFLMPTLSTFNEQRASRAISHSPRRPSRSPPPSRRTEPREEYLRTSLEPSWHVDAPETARKLIVLDLNGSLLVRSAHQKRPPLPRHGHGNHNSQSQETSSTNPYADPTAFRPVRTVYPRPYLSSFVEYILHPTTKKWLDTMVWSSAQPHSVDDMVGRCFKERREELRAVWARNTLGLTGDEYHKKSLTLKDLEKPWTELPIIPSGSETSSSPPASCSLPSSPPASDPAATSDPTTMPSSSNTNPTAPSDTPHLPSNLHLKSSSYANHSERTTLLIDDSPLKAALQPWNHLVIREYLQELRNRDLKVAELERTRAEKEKDASVSKSEGEDAVVGQSERLGDKNEFAGVDVGITAAAAQNVVETEATSLAEPSIIPVPFDSTSKDVPIDIASAADDAQARKLKRLQKEAGKLKRAEEHAKRIAEEVGEQVYDQTLLAVIGILDRMRWEGNVAGWLRAGGLMDVEGVDVNVTEGVASEIVGTEGVESKNGSERTEEMAGRALTLTHTPPTRSRDASLSPGPSSLPGDNSSSKKRRRVSDENENVDVDGAKSAKTNIGMDTSADAAKSFSDGEKSIDTTIDGVQSAHALAPEAEIEKEEQASTGVPSISEATSADALPNMTVAPTPTATETPKLWYEHPDILSFWAERGRKALAELGIEVQSDMVVNGSSNGKAG